MKYVRGTYILLVSSHTTYIQLTLLLYLMLLLVLHTLHTTVMYIASELMVKDHVVCLLQITVTLNISLTKETARLALRLSACLVSVNFTVMVTLSAILLDLILTVCIVFFFLKLSLIIDSPG